MKKFVNTIPLATWEKMSQEDKELKLKAGSLLIFSVPNPTTIHGEGFPTGAGKI